MESSAQETEQLRIRERATRPRSSINVRAWPWRRPIVVFGLVVCWLFAMLPTLGMLYLPVLLLVLALLLARKAWKTAGVFFLLQPTTFVVGQGAFDYSAGTAKLRFIGLPGTTSFNIDPICRCPRTGGGCLVFGGEWVQLLPYNLTVHALVSSLGYMPGSYDGPYPSEFEAKTALANSTPVSADAISNDVVIIAGDATSLSKGIGETLLSSVGYRWWPDALFPASRPIRAVTWQGRCLILEIPTEHLEEPPSAMIVVIDRRVGRPFAYYDEGNYYHRSPPVGW